MKRTSSKLLSAAVVFCLFISPSLSLADIYNVESTITSPDYNQYSGGHTAPIEVFIGTPNKPFQEMALLKATGSRDATDEEFIDALKKKAAEINVDGISNLQFSVEPGRLVKVNGVLTTTKVRVARATAVIFTGPN